MDNDRLAAFYQTAILTPDWPLTQFGLLFVTDLFKFFIRMHRDYTPDGWSIGRIVILDSFTFLAFIGLNTLLAFSSLPLPTRARLGQPSIRPCCSLSFFTSLPYLFSHFSSQFKAFSFIVVTGVVSLGPLSKIRWEIHGKMLRYGFRNNWKRRFITLIRYTSV